MNHEQEFIKLLISKSMIRKSKCKPLTELLFTSSTWTPLFSFLNGKVNSIYSLVQNKSEGGLIFTAYYAFPLPLADRKRLSFHFKRWRRQTTLNLTRLTGWTFECFYRWFPQSSLSSQQWKSSITSPTPTFPVRLNVASVYSSWRPICLHLWTHSLSHAGRPWHVGGCRHRKLMNFSKSTWHTPQMASALHQQVQSRHRPPHTMLEVAPRHSGSPHATKPEDVNKHMRFEILPRTGISRWKVIVK